MAGTRFIAFHEVPESEQLRVGEREFREETGGTAANLEWLGLVEVSDGNTHFGAVYRCTVEQLPETFENEETGGLAF